MTVKQGLSPAVAAVVILIVVLLVVAIGYFVFVRPKTPPAGHGGAVDYSAQQAPPAAAAKAGPTEAGNK
jgi:hypothetical protein